MKLKNSLLPYVILPLALIICVAALRFVFIFSDNSSSIVSNNSERRRIIIDAGHGGKDGGAVSVNGSYEKTLNLQVSTNIEEILYLLGYDIIMTRDHDVELTHSDGGTRKMQDLKGRLQISRDNPDVPFVSIHMNKFPQSKYSGLQIYYSKNNEQSRIMSSLIREQVIAKIQPENTRGIKKANENIYLLDKITSPAILIECGFLSNEEESRQLDDHVYRMKLSFVIANTLNLWYNGCTEN